MPALHIDPAHRVDRPRCGFTLIEALVTIIILLTMIAFLLPAIASTKSGAGRVQTLSAIRQMHAGLMLYTTEAQGAFPFLGTPGQPEADLIVNGVRVGTGRDGVLYFWQHSQLWASVVAPYLSGNPSTPLGPVLSDVVDARDPTGGSGPVLHSTVFMSHTAFAHRRFWTDTGPHLGRDLVGTSLAEVRWPARKALLFHTFPERTPAQTAFIGFADGSAGTLPWSMHMNIDPDPLPAFNLITSLPTMATRDGLSGVDI